jgi:hypothetical protein
MKEKPATSVNSVPARARAAYEKPVVRDFGSVGTLTQSGTIMTGETTPGMMGPMRNMP